MATLLRLWVGVTAAAAIFAAGAGYTNIAVVKERQFAAQPDEGMNERPSTTRRGGCTIAVNSLPAFSSFFFYSF
jgi:hypothetical protein